MSLSARAQSRVPPGFRFHPTEEELLHYYLRKKVACEVIDLDVIQDVDLNKLEPWDIQGKCRIGSTPQNDWYFFSHKDKKYPTGTRTNRATAAGFWKATGRDKVIYANSRRIGMRKTLVFYTGRAPHGLKSDWIMHEYRLDDNTDSTCSHSIASDSLGEATQEEGWVVCRVFKKKNTYKTTESAEESKINSESPENFFNSGNDGTLDQILQGMGRGCKQETEVKNNNSTIQLPQLESQTLLPNSNDWAALDRLVASHLSGQEEASKSLVCFNDLTLSLTTSQPFDSFFTDSDQELQLPQLRSTNMLLFNNNQDYSCDIDLWSFARSSSSSNPLTSSPRTSNSGFVSTTSG